MYQSLANLRRLTPANVAKHIRPAPNNASVPGSGTAPTADGVVAERSVAVQDSPFASVSSNTARVGAVSGFDMTKPYEPGLSLNISGNTGSVAIVRLPPDA